MVFQLQLISPRISPYISPFITVGASFSARKYVSRRIVVVCIRGKIHFFLEKKIIRITEEKKC